MLSNWDVDPSDFNDETVALGREEAAALTRHALNQAAAREAEAEGDRITPVSSPVSDELLGQDYVRDAMEAFDRRVFSAAPPPAAPTPASADPVPPAPPRAPTPAFNPGVTPGGQTSAGTARAGMPPGTPVANPFPFPPPSRGPTGAAAPPSPAAAPNPFPAKLSRSPTPAAVPSPGANPRSPEDQPLVGGSDPTASQETEPARADDEDEETRMLASEDAASLAAPGPPTSGGDEGEDERTRMYQGPSDGEGEDESTRLFEPEADVGPPASVNDDAETRVADGVSGDTDPGISSSAARRRPALPPVADPSAHAAIVVHGEEVGDAVPPLASLGPPPVFDPQTGTAVSAYGRGGWGLYLFFASTGLLLVLVTIFFFRRELFEVGVQRMREAVGLETRAPVALGPPFDTQRAGEVLAKQSAKVEKCREAGGPTGAGRVRVLFQPTGQASSAAVSAPFHQTTVGDCLVELFKSSEVPAFGGQPVIVTKSFLLP